MFNALAGKQGVGHCSPHVLDDTVSLDKDVESSGKVAMGGVKSGPQPVHRPASSLHWLLTGPASASLSGAQVLVPRVLAAERVQPPAEGDRRQPRAVLAERCAGVPGQVLRGCAR